MGDFNAQTGKNTDIVSVDEVVVGATGIDADLFDAFGSADNAELLGIDLTRYSHDVVLNGNGNELLQCCKMADLKIINGRFGQDSGIGSFTCSNVNGNSVVDYAIASTNFLPNVSDLRIEVFDKCPSDIHCPLSLTLSFRALNPGPEVPNTSNHDVSHNSVNPIVIKWDANLAESYTNSFDAGKLVKLKDAITDFTNAVMQQCRKLLIRKILSNSQDISVVSSWTQQNSVALKKNQTR